MKDQGQVPKVEGFCSRVGQLVDVLEGAGVAFALIKTVRPFRYADGNVDVLVPDAGQFRWAARTFTVQGFKPVFTFEFDKRMLLPPPDDRLPAIHLYPALSWYGVRYLDAQGLVAGRRWVDWEGMRVPILAPWADALVYALHAFFEEEALTLGDAVQLRAAPADWAEHAGQLAPEGGAVRWALRCVSDALDALDWSYVDALLPVTPNNVKTSVWRFSEGDLWRGFLCKLTAEARALRPLGLGMALYAYGGIHVLKKWGVLRG